MDNLCCEELFWRRQNYSGARTDLSGEELT